jgi:hypothetical protein
MKTRDTFIILRVDQATKDRWASVAQMRGQNLSTFVWHAVEKAAKQEQEGKKMPVAIAKPKGKGACPSWFFYQCQDCSRGGAWSYAAAGYWLVQKLFPAFCPMELTEREWDANLEELDALLKNQKNDAVIAWLEKAVPRCMALVPKRRRRQFLSGVYEAFDENGMIPR